MRVERKRQRPGDNRGRDLNGGRDGLGHRGRDKERETQKRRWRGEQRTQANSK